MHFPQHQDIAYDDDTDDLYGGTYAARMERLRALEWSPVLICAAVALGCIASDTAIKIRNTFTNPPSASVHRTEEAESGALHSPVVGSDNAHR